ncbi:hypothetical protein F5148DRAFT_1239603 [Russula earlei]|uniref:Uncharacterized protein n=1 Tax=Russula earlei TaxID=71964 RepID=A0ACC0TWB9_9AGAM|nr:hypothetical protein F5148DRAFT_1239603 [Russula earlei]
MLKAKRETSSRYCAPVSSSIRVCWVDLLFISLILLVVACFLFGVPLTARLCKMLRGIKNNSSPAISSHHILSERGYWTPTRRRHSQEMLFDGGLGNGGSDKLDGAFLPPFLFSGLQQWPTHLNHDFCGTEVISHDPFLIVQPSLNDSVLVKQGLVEETMLPPPTHNAYDIRGPLVHVGRNENAFETPSRTRSRSCTDATPVPSKVPGLKDTPMLCSRDSRVAKDTTPGESHEMDSRLDAVPPPPPVYTIPFLGQGKHTILFETV